MSELLERGARREVDVTSLSFSQFFPQVVKHGRLRQKDVQERRGEPDPGPHLRNYLDSAHCFVLLLHLVGSFGLLFVHGRTREREKATEVSQRV